MLFKIDAAFIFARAGLRKRVRSRNSLDVCLTDTWQICSDFQLAASLGLEPRQRDPESLVLPLHHEATSEKIKTDLTRCKSSAVALGLN